MDSHCTKMDTQALTLFTAHIKYLRNIPWTKHAHITLFAERGTGLATGHFRTALFREEKNVSVFTELEAGEARRAMIEMRDNGESIQKYEADNEDMFYSLNPGYQPTSENKTNWLTASKLKVNTGGVMWADCSFSTNPFTMDHSASEKLSVVKGKFYDQLARSIIYKRSSRVAGNEIYGWSAKANAQGVLHGGYNDDIVMAFTAACWFWPLAMSGHLLGFPYKRAGLFDLDNDPNVKRNRQHMQADYGQHSKEERRKILSRF